MARTPYIGTLPLALVLSFSTTFALAERTQDDLLSVVQETLAAQPELQIRLNAFNASVHDEREAFGGYLPSIDLNAAVGMGDRDYDGRGSYNRNNAEISLTQMLFDGFRVRNSVAKTKHESRARYYEFLDEAETKALEASEVYQSVLKYRKLVSFAQQNVVNHQKVQRLINNRVNQGISTRADLQQIEGRLSLARTNLMTEVANLQTITARFERLVGRLPAEQLEAFTINAQAVPASLSQVLTDVYANNPALFAAFEGIQASEASYREARSSRYPTIELGASHGTYKNNSSFDQRIDPHNYGNETVVELRMRYNLYRGGSDSAAERAASSRTAQATSIRDKACVDLRQTATIAYGDVFNLKIKLDDLKAHRDKTKDVLAAYNEQFDIGRRSLLDVLDSQNESYQADRAYISGFYDLEIHRLQTLHSMGRLLETLAVTNSQQPDLGEINSSVSPGSNRYCALPNDYDSDWERYLPEDLDELVTLGSDALFDSGSAELKSAGLKSLQEFAIQILTSGTPRGITITGHTDSSGTDALNQKLSLERALAVRSALIDSGIGNTVIQASGVGSSQPVASNESVEGRASNRRVEVLVTHVKKPK